MAEERIRYDYKYFLAYADGFFSKIELLEEGDLYYNKSESYIIKNITNIQTMMEHDIFPLIKTPTISKFSFITEFDEFNQTKMYSSIESIITEYMISPDDIQDGAVSTSDCLYNLAHYVLFIRYDKISGTIKLIHSDKIKERITEHLLMLEDETDEKFKVKTEKFHSTIKKALNKFQSGVITTSYGDIVPFQKNDLNEIVYFPNSKRNQKKFLNSLKYKLGKGMGVDLKINTSSFINSNNVLEVYGFYFYLSMVTVIDINHLHSNTRSKLEQLGDKEAYKYHIYCDLKGNKKGYIIS